MGRVLWLLDMTLLIYRLVAVDLSLVLMSAGFAEFVWTSVSFAIPIPDLEISLILDQLSPIATQVVNVT